MWEEKSIYQLTKLKREEIDEYFKYEIVSVMVEDLSDKTLSEAFEKKGVDFLGWKKDRSIEELIELNLLKLVGKNTVKIRVFVPKYIRSCDDRQFEFVLINPVLDNIKKIFENETRLLEGEFDISDYQFASIRIDEDATYLFEASGIYDKPLLFKDSVALCLVKKTYLYKFDSSGSTQRTGRLFELLEELYLKFLEKHEQKILVITNFADQTKKFYQIEKDTSTIKNLIDVKPEYFNTKQNFIANKYNLFVGTKKSDDGKYSSYYFCTLKSGETKWNK
ncbi:MAG: hypothetical protein ACRCZB_04995 [Bacteroidales bacterium]